ncbi:hypothetical protein C8F04DRAFT_713265 [Mycena alexandri]|uniref:DUF7730 domain-containing protein n=1 Tax=Mycena alexandri TaxID=1745969 RepID=A0AAD6SS19_9AGAR|nr:hypothetical protein C8F04DRAFT_713265 [Mycena alexandri]
MSFSDFSWTARICLCFLMLFCPCLLCCPIGPRKDRPLPPRKRVQIRRRRLIAQPHSLLMKLPLELRERIYEHALGGRVVELQRVASWHNGRIWFLGSTCHEFVDDSHGRPPVLRDADPLPTALLRACRQIYFEALPVLQHCTTFRLESPELTSVLDASLGSHYLSEIRSIYLCPSYTRHAPPSSNIASHGPWEGVFAVLHRMRLDCLVFEFDFVQLEGTELDPKTNVLDGAWGRGVLGMRHLRWFDVVFRNGDPPEHPMYRAELVQRVRKALHCQGIES